MAYIYRSAGCENRSSSHVFAKYTRFIGQNGRQRYFAPSNICIFIFMFNCEATHKIASEFLSHQFNIVVTFLFPGLVSVSGFGQPTESVDDFEFKDTATVDGPATGMGYNYPQSQITADAANPAASYDTAPAANNNMLSLYNIQEPKPQFSVANTYNIPDYPINAHKGTLQSKKDDFKVFHDIPASSMLLTNYDPFYSPLLSRLDSVFQQLNLNGDNEACREKLICLMYASPAKYMPYSNLVSAQLSR